MGKSTNMSLSDLENFLSSRRSTLQQTPRGIARAQGALRQAEAERQMRDSVMSRQVEPEWQPDYERKGGHALEAPMISPDDLIGTGIPTKIAMAVKGAAPLIGGLGVVKQKGGNWLTGSVEDALKGLKKNQLVAADLEPNSGVNALNSFIDKQLTRYVKNEMATPEDPIRALAERGVLHYDPTEMALIQPKINLALRRPAAGFPASGLGESPMARQWEHIADVQIGGNKARDWRREAEPEVLARIPGLEKIPDEVSIFERTSPAMVNNLGFNHLTDELANALNPNSGLPRHLLLDPASMPRVSVPQAVERVAAINAWRAAQKAEADALRANNAATVLHKEYPDKGYKWVELRQPDETGRLVQGAERMDPRFEIPQEIQDQFQEQAYQEALRRGIADESDDMMGFVEGRTQELARQWDAKNPARIDEARKTLQDALKYEGDTMGHCVGGYCDDVASGRTKIYSLRDAKGQPHVTIEVQPMKAGYLPEPSADPSAEIAPRIVQIKGKQNRAPNEEYLPFVQDFVRSGQWSDVGDLQNTGLTKVGDRFVSDAEAAALAERHFGGKWGNKPAADENPFRYFNRVNRYDEDMLSDADKAFIADWKAGNFASGGSVKTNPFTVQSLQAIIAQLRQEHINA